MICKSVEFIDSGSFPDTSTWTILLIDDKSYLFWKFRTHITTFSFELIKDAYMKIQNLFAEIYEGIF